MVRVSSGLMPAVGSSSSSSRGRLASAMPISSARCSPCASVFAARSRDSHNPTSASNSSACSVSSCKPRARTPHVVARHQRLQPDADILPRRQLRKHVGDLERFRHAHMGEAVLRQPGDVAALEFDATAGGRKRAGQQIEIGALAGAVGTDDRGDRALGEFGRDVVQRDEFAEHLADAPGAQDHRLRSRSRRVVMACPARSACPRCRPGRTARKS